MGGHRIKRHSKRKECSAQPKRSTFVITWHLDGSDHVLQGTLQSELRGDRACEVAHGNLRRRILLPADASGLVDELQELSAVAEWVFAFAFAGEVAHGVPGEFSALLGVAQEHAESGDADSELEVLR